MTPVDPITTLGPLLFIFAVSALKEAIDDYGRYKADKAANERMYTVVRDGRRVRLPSAAIHVGDMLEIVDG